MSNKILTEIYDDYPNLRFLHLSGTVPADASSFSLLMNDIDEVFDELRKLRYANGLYERHGRV